MSRSRHATRLRWLPLETRLVPTAGLLDPTFGVGGRVSTAFPAPADDRCSATAVDSLDRVILAGSSTDVTTNNSYFTLVRFMPNGALDTTFGGTGRVSFAFGVNENHATAVTVDSQDRVIVAGYTNDGTNIKIAVARLNSSGVLDTSFDSDGKQTIVVGAGGAKAQGLAIDSQGRIVLAGSTNVGPHDDFAIVRLTASGALDLSFDGDGKQIFDIGGSNSTASSLAIDSQDRIIAAGQSYNGSHYGFAVARLNNSGALDSNFDGDGKQWFAYGTDDEGASSVAVDSLDRVIIGGTANFGIGAQIAVVRLTSVGAVDSMFDGDGAQTIYTSSYGGASSIAVDSQDRVLVAGGTSNTNNADFAVARLTTTGILDTTFDSDGIKSIDFGGDDDAASVAMASQGRVVIAGNRYYPSYQFGNSDFALARVNGDGAHDATFDGDGQQIIGFSFGSDAEPGRVKTDSLGRIVVAGIDFGTYEMSITRYLPDGTLDPSFGGTGIVAHNIPDLSFTISLAIDSQDRVLVATGQYDIHVARFTASGALDDMFGTAGDQTIAFPNTSTYAGGIAVDSLDRVVVTGALHNGIGMAVARLTSSGVLDTTFDTDGQETISFGVVGSYLRVAIDSQGRIVVAGTTNSSSIALVRLTTAGLLDSSFGIAGKQSVQFSNQGILIVNTVVDSLDRVIVAELLANADAFGVTRFTAAGALDSSFDTDGKQSISFGPNTYTRDVAVDALDRIVLVGDVQNGSNYDFGVARLTASGSLDPTFSADGKQAIDFGMDDYASGVTVDSFGRVIEVGYVYGGSPFGIYWDVIRLTGDTPPSKLTTVTVNDGSPQRSMVSSLKVTFDSKVSFDGSPASAFQLTRQSDNAPVALSANVDPSGTFVTLTFTGGAIDLGGSLADGRYTLKILANHFGGLGFDGDGDGLAETSPADDYVLVGTPVNGLFRLFGDADGNGTINSTDFASFRTFFGIGPSYFDFNNDGQTNSNDFAEFRKRFGLMI